MAPDTRPARGRFLAAVLVSLGLHAAAGLGWFAARGSAAPSTDEIETRVAGPDDGEVVINLRDPRPAKMRSVVVAEPVRAPELAVPATLPPSVRDPGPNGVRYPVISPAGGPPLKKSDGGVPLHGEVKAGSSVVYVLDRSSSMGPDGLLRKAVAAIKASLGQLGPETRFNVVGYNRGASRLAPESLTASRENCDRAAEWLDTLTAEGGSDHRIGLREALANRPDAVVLLTDADDLDERDVRTIRGMLGKSVSLSVAVFGTGEPGQETALGQLLRERGGAVRYVASKATPALPR